MGKRAVVDTSTVIAFTAVTVATLPANIFFADNHLLFDVLSERAQECLGENDRHKGVLTASKTVLCAHKNLSFE